MVSMLILSVYVVMLSLQDIYIYIYSSSLRGESSTVRCINLVSTLPFYIFTNNISYSWRGSG